MKNLKVFKSAVATIMATITMGSTASVVSAKKSDWSKGEIVGVITDSTKGKVSSLDIYDEDIVETLKNPVEVFIPTGITVKRDESLRFNYATVTLPYGSRSMNPDELVQIIDAAAYLQEETYEDSFVYTDGNGTVNDYFTKDKSTRKLTKRQLERYIDDLHDDIEDEREDIDHSKYAEFMLPVLPRYEYKKTKKTTGTYIPGLDYVYFYVPYSELSNETNMAELAEIVYTRFQEKHDYVVTWNEILKTQREMEKEQSKVKTK